MKKKLLMLALAVCLLVSMMPSMAFAQTVTPPSGLSVEWQGKYYSAEDTIELKAGERSYDMKLYYNGKKLTEYVAVKYDGNLGKYGVEITPDNTLNVYAVGGVVSSSANFTVTLSYNNQKTKIAIKVLSGDGLAVEWHEKYYRDGDTIELVADRNNYTFPIYFNGKKLEEYIVPQWTGNTGDYAVEVTPDNTLNIYTVGGGAGGSADFSVILPYGDAGAEIKIKIVTEGSADDGIDIGSLAFNVKWKEELISGGSNIYIEEGSGYSLLIYYGEQENDGSIETHAKSNSKICSAGITPDNKYLELYLSEEAKAGDSCKVTVSYGNGSKKASVKYTVKVISEGDNIEQVDKLVGKIALTMSSAKTSKKNTKVTIKTDKQSAAAIQEIKDLGYTVKYKYYRSTKKSTKYAAKQTKTGRTYTSTSGKKGVTYYYKAKLMVYDENGKLAAQTTLSQCKAAKRAWLK